MDNSKCLDCDPLLYFDIGRKMFFLQEKNVEPKRVDLCLQGGGDCEKGEGNGNYRIATFPVSVPGIIPSNYGRSHP